MIYTLQLSSVRENEYYPLSDSNYNFAKNLILGIRKILDENELRIIALFPGQLNKSNEEDVAKFLSNISVEFEKIPMTTNVFGTRFDFNYNLARALVEDCDPDFIFENNPVHVRAWKTVINDLKTFGQMPKDRDIKLITYFHWLDSPLYPKVPKEISYWLRQAEGVITADYVMFNSYYAMDQIVESFEKTILKSYFDTYGLSKKFFKIPPSFSESILEDKISFEKDNGIIFNHRLSSLPYYKENFNNLVQLLVKFNNEHDFFPRVYFTNPSRKSIPELPFRADFVEFDEDTYHDLLGSYNVGIAPNFFVNSFGMWSIATMEAGIFENAVILPYKFGYIEMAKKEYKGFFTNLSEAYQLFEKCILSAEFRKELVAEFLETTSEFENINVAKKFLKIINLK